MSEDTARVYTDVRDFPIYVSHLDDRTRIWFAPYRIWDGSTAVLGIACTGWAVWHWLNSGHVVVIGLVGLAITAGATWLARLIPVSRPSPLYRALWLATVALSRQKRAAA
ncbi:MAG: hypothetical protein JOZ49_03555, partial [Mycolicibacterium sp.]|nr:hypothetical protein [Mycolicibacterium sp.]